MLLLDLVAFEVPFFIVLNQKHFIDHGVDFGAANAVAIGRVEELLGGNRSIGVIRLVSRERDVVFPVA